MPSLSLLVVYLAVALAISFPAAGAAHAQEPHVRALDPFAAGALERGQHRSQRFRELVEELNSSDVIVHVVTTPGLTAGRRRHDALRRAARRRALPPRRSLLDAVVRLAGGHPRARVAARLRGGALRGLVFRRGPGVVPGHRQGGLGPRGRVRDHGCRCGPATKSATSCGAGAGASARSKISAERSAGQRHVRARATWTGGSVPEHRMRPVRLGERGGLGIGQRDRQAGDQLIELLQLRRADDRRGHPGLPQHPGQRHLDGQHALRASPPRRRARRRRSRLRRSRGRGRSRRAARAASRPCGRAVRLPARKPRASGLHGITPMPSSRQSGIISRSSSR